MSRGRKPSVSAAIVNCLRAAEGRFVTMKSLIDIVYARDPNGGALDAQSSLGVLILRLRRLGYPIHGNVGHGYRFVPTVWEIQPETDVEEVAA